MTVTINLLTFFKIAGVALFAGAAIVIVTLIAANIKRFFASRKYDDIDRQDMRRRWTEIEALLDKGGELSSRIAVIEADKLLDHALKARAMPGSSLGDRLRFAQYAHPKLKRVWWAHKVRNQLVHEDGYHIDRGAARKAVHEFEQALKLIGAI